MSRFVAAKQRRKPGPKAASESTKDNIKEYTERVAKYVPAEILSAFTILNTTFTSAEGRLRFWGLLISTFLLWILTPIYFWWMKKPEDEPSFKTQTGVSFVAFIIWAYVISGDQGIFGKDGLGLYVSQVGVALMVFFTLISGFIIPRKP